MESSESQNSTTTDESQTSTKKDNSPKTSPPSSRRQKWWLALSLLLLLLAGGGGFALWRVLQSGSSPPATAQQKPRATPVKLQEVETSTVVESSQYVGNLNAQQEIILRPKTEGRVTQVLVSAGEVVEQGTPILELSPERSQAEVEAAKARVQAAREARNNARAELQALQAELKSAAAEVKLQKEEFRRVKFLVSQGAQSQQQLDQARRNLEAAQSTLNAAQQRVQAARSSLEQANATLAQAQANAQAARTDLQDKNVVAPISGEVGDIPVKIGDYVAVGDNLTTITQNQTLELRLSIPIDRANQLRRGLPVELSSAGGERTLATGQISFVASRANPNTQTILAKARFPNREGELRDQQKVQARVIWDKQPGILVPTTAISRLGGQTFVFVASKPSQSQQQEQQGQQGQQGKEQLVARQKPVELGGIQDNRYQVLSGLEPGQTIVTSGIMSLTDGAAIMPAPQGSSTQKPQPQ